MKIFNIKAIGVCFAVAGVAAVAVSNPTYAAEKTWVGKGANINFSTAANWSDGVAPVNGDSLVFAPLVIADGGKPVGENDIAGLSVSGISFVCTEVLTKMNTNFYAKEAITLTGDVTSSDCNSALALDGSFVLGADISIKDVPLGGTTAQNTDQKLDLNKHTLTVSSSNGNFIIRKPFDIRGNGTVNYNSSGSIRSENTYTGTTNINVASGIAGAMRSVDSEYLAGFGTSTININTGKVSFELYLGEYDSNGSINGKTLPNKINIKNNISNFYSLSFDCSTILSAHCTGNEVLKVPGINMLSNIGINTNNIKIDLAGITTNGHCVEYWETDGIVDSGKPTSFLNAPQACKVDDADTPTPPGVPNTSGNITNNPIAILSIGAGIALVAFALTREKKTA